jgi:AhpD family alkylhydroperoxidase
MQIIQQVQPEHAAGVTKRLLETIKAEGGETTNMIKTMAQSPYALDAYLQFKRALASGRVGPKIRAQIALTVAQANRCEYSLARHSEIARRQGLAEDEIAASREGHAKDEEIEVLLQFVSNLATRNGRYSPEELRDAGYSDSEIIEIVAWVALNVFDNYVNLVAKTDMDAPAKARAA